MDYHRLGLGSASSLVRAVRVTDWGASVLVDCIYDPLEERKEYQLSFQGCSQLRIDMMPDASVQEQQADLLGITLGQEGGRQPAVLTTDLFELHVTYRQFLCHKDGGAGRAEPVAATDRGRHFAVPEANQPLQTTPPA